MNPDESTATVCVVGAGPAGAMLALLLARSGVDVLLLEKHADFLRDFRGDTVHPVTLELLDELGLTERLLALPHRKLTSIEFFQDGAPLRVSDFTDLGLRFPFIAVVPQWDFLTLLTTEAARYPGFRLEMKAEATGLIRENGRVAGVSYRTPEGVRKVRTSLVVAADGRNSVVRQAAGLRPREFAVRTDAIPFWISRRETDPDEGLSVRIGRGALFVVLNRNTYWQLSYVVDEGGYDRLRREGIGRLHEDLRALVPFLGDRADEVPAIEEATLLKVHVNRLRRWYVPGMVCIGDAAHTMSPVGGSGIALAIQDATAAANILAGPLLRCRRDGRPLDTRPLARLQRRRRPPAVLTQEYQRLLQRFGVDRALRGKHILASRQVMAAFERLPPVRRTLSRFTSVGVRPEHIRTPPPVPPADGK